jgi:hypothetical protein
MPKIIVPIGLQFGPSYADDSRKPRYYVVGRATGPVHLDEAAHRIWTAAHGDRDSAIDLTMSRQGLAKVARDRDVGQPEPIIEKLLADGVLAELNTAMGTYRGFLERYRLQPLAYGWGNDPEDREVSHLGWPWDKQALKVPGEVRSVWEMGLTPTSIWTRIEFVAEQAAKVPDLHKNYTADPDEIADLVVGFIPLFVAVGCGFLDDHVVDE